jgi:hypothetical protein
MDATAIAVMGGAVMENGLLADRQNSVMLDRRGIAGHLRSQDLFEQELAACRSIAKRCAFVFGPARSGTTIVAQLINASDRAFLTTEANYHLACPHPDFRAWYNNQHRQFGNQICKSTYAPNLGNPGESAWWNWLERAAVHFDIVGDKSAFKDFTPGRYDFNSVMSFFEARFFASRYIFIFRDPIQTILSSITLWNSDPLSLVLSWACFVRFWADFVRIFPCTLTILHSQLEQAKVAEIGAFLGIDLTESDRLLDQREQRLHRLADAGAGESVSRLVPLLQMIYGEIKETLSSPRVLLQCDQKCDRQGGLTAVPGARPTDIALETTPVGRAWNLADQLVASLQDRKVG